MAVYDFQAISTPIIESSQQHGAPFSLCWDLACWNLLAAQQGSCCQRTGHGGPAVDCSLPRSEHFLLHNFKGQSCVSLSNSNAPGTVRSKTLFAFAKLTKRRRHLSSGTRQNWPELASECLMLQTLRAGGSTAWEISESQDGVLLPVSVCLWPLTAPLCK